MRNGRENSIPIMPARNPLKCDLFCAVIDNYGDAGVCWRLAKQLAAQSGWHIRLVIDKPGLIAPLEGVGSIPSDGVLANGITIVAWEDASSLRDAGDVVIEAFGCRLPDTHLTAMRSRKPAPVWINLEYLSAEAWVESCHGLPSPDPESGLVKYFFFPGFTERTGGVLLEPGYATLATEFAPARRRAEFLNGIAGPVNEDDAPVSVFCYPGSNLRELILASAGLSIAGRRPLWLLTEPVGRLRVELPAGCRDRVRHLPFLSQADYDRLLLSCTVNLVRGEDSFVRAQLAARPFVWQAYRQEEDAHLVKVESFLGRYLCDAPFDVRRAIEDVWKGWNRGEPVDAKAWAAFVDQAPAIAALNAQWLGGIAIPDDLAARLARFCESRL